MADVDVLIRFLAQKDASVTSALAQLRGDIQSAAGQTAAAGRQATQGAAQAAAAVKSMMPSLAEAHNAVLAASQGAQALTLTLSQTQAAAAPVASVASTVGTLGKALQAASTDARALSTEINKVQATAGKQALDAARATRTLPGTGGAQPPTPPSGGTPPTPTPQPISARSLTEMREAAEKIASAAGKAALALGGVAAGLLGVGVLIVQRAAEMQQFQAKLETVQHSATKAGESIKFAVEEAAKTPFEVKGLVEATVNLEVYHQRARETLPFVENLAAGMGRSIEATSLVLGKALSGSQEGFESLRNEYGISSVALKQFGAVVDNTGQLSLKTSAEIEKAGRAALAFVGLNFAGAAERQSRTFSGAMSNLQDAISRLAVSLGRELLPVLTDLVKGVTGVVEVFEQMPDGLKQVIVFGGAAVGALAGLGAGLAGLVALGGSAAATVLDVGRAVGILSAASAAATGPRTLAGGLAALEGPATRIVGVLGNVTKSLVGLAVANPVIAGIIAIGAGIYYTTNQNRAAQEALDKALVDQSRELQRAATSWRDFKSAVDAAAKGSAGATGQVNLETRSIQDLIALIDQIPPEKLAQAFAARGINLQDLRKVRNEARQEVEATLRDREILLSLQSRIQKIGQGNELDIQRTGLSTDDKKRAEELLGTTVAGAEKVEEALKGVNFQLDRQKTKTAGLGETVDVLEKYDAVLEGIGKRYQGLQDFLDFSDKVGTVEAYRQKLVAIDAAILKTQGDLASSKSQLPTDSLGIGLALQDPATTPEARAALKHFGDLQKQRRDTVKAAEEADKQDRDKRIDVLRKTLADEEQLGNVSFARKREVQAAITAIAKGNAELEAREAQHSAVLQKQERDFTTHGVEQAFADRLNASKEFIAQKKALNQLSSSDEIAAIGRQIAFVQKFKAEHKKMLSDPDNRNFALGIEKELRGLTVSQAEAVSGAYEKNLSRADHLASEFLADQEAKGKRSLDAQRQDVQTLESWWQGLINSGQVRGAAAIEKLNALRREDAKLAIAIQERDFETNQQLLQARQAELATRREELKEQLSQGKNVADQILANLEQQTALKLKSIDDIAAHEREVIGLTDLQKRAINEREALGKLDALRAEKKLVDDVIASQNQGAQDLLNKLQQIKEIAKPKEEKKDDTAPKFGDDFGDAAKKRAAEDIARIAKKGSAADRAEIDTLRTALGQFGIQLDTSLDQNSNPTFKNGEIDPRTGLPRISLGGVQTQFGASVSQAQLQAFKSRSSELGLAIDRLEKSMGADSALVTALHDLTAALGGKPAGGTPTTSPTPAKGDAQSEQPPATSASGGPAASIEDLRARAQRTANATFGAAQAGGVGAYAADPAKAKAIEDFFKSSDGFYVPKTTTQPPGARAGQAGTGERVAHVENHFNLQGLSIGEEAAGFFKRAAEAVRRRANTSVNFDPTGGFMGGLP